MKGTASILSKHNWDVAAVNYRSCSGHINLKPRMYHSGATEDIDAIVNFFVEKYEEIVLVGFSLGGNLALKYCGEKSSNLHPAILLLLQYLFLLIWKQDHYI